MKRTILLLICSMFLAVLPASARGKGGTKPLPTIIDNFPIVLTGTNVLNLDSIDYTSHNNIELHDNAVLMITNAVFRHMTDYSWQFELNAYDNSKVIVSSSTLISSPSVVWNFWDSSSLELTNVINTSFGVWSQFHQNAKATVKTGSRFYGTLSDSAAATMDTVPETFIEFQFPVDSIVDEAFPAKLGKRATYTFPNSNDSGVNTRLTMKNVGSVGSKWAIVYVPTSEITIRNTAGLTVTYHVPSTFSGITAEFSGLMPQLYSDKTWFGGNAMLHLVQTSMQSWSPAICGNNTLIVSDSELTDTAYSFGNALFYIYRSTVHSVRSNNYVNMHYYDSSISEDVVAADNSLIELHNTTVSGRIKEEDNGKVVVYQN